MTKPYQFDQRLKQGFADYQPEIFSLDRPQAAVLVPLIMLPEPSVLLTVRAAHLNSHPGEVSFPGGMVEAVDRSLSATALRETYEEIGFEPTRFDVMGQLSTTLSKNGVLVYPIVGLALSAEGSQASPDEIAEIFTVPWSFFATQAPELQSMDRHGFEFPIPHFYYQDKHIWGLTAMILLELINLLEGTAWPIPDFASASLPGAD
ncbi:CoA pyrophosphatase [Reinekea sp.]|uniref:NUDIX hydrolase n=1 Tax=Reinekea sp. TaxID=1970455 RepID=UPI002A81A354|nr:CoA pyrophosphatase [Reinekea sp.]